MSADPPPEIVLSCDDGGACVHFEGTREQLIAWGLVRAGEFPEGRKRSRSCNRSALANVLKRRSYFVAVYYAGALDSFKCLRVRAVRSRIIAAHIIERFAADPNAWAGARAYGAHHLYERTRAVITGIDRRDVSSR